MAAGGRQWMQFSKMNGNIENFLKIPKVLNVVKRDLKAQLVVACLRLKNYWDEKDLWIGKNIELHAKKLNKVFFLKHLVVKASMKSIGPLPCLQSTSILLANLAT